MFPVVVIDYVFIHFTIYLQTQGMIYYKVTLSNIVVPPIVLLERGFYCREDTRRGSKGN